MTLKGRSACTGYLAVRKPEGLGEQQEEEAGPGLPVALRCQADKIGQSLTANPAGTQRKGTEMKGEPLLSGNGILLTVHCLRAKLMSFTDASTYVRVHYSYT